LTQVNRAAAKSRSTDGMSHRTLRHLLGGAAIVGGALLMWLSPEVLGGAVVMAAGIALELFGIALDRG
jgi:hypothetical protein